jgi:hypothetical protein
MESGDQLLNSMRVRGEMPIPIAHNDLVIEFLRTDRDTLCIAEDDHVGSQDVLRKMRQKEENWDFDVVCASYVNRTPRAGATVAVGFWFVPEEDGEIANDYGEYSVTMKPMETAETGTQEVDGSALGLVLIRRWLLEAMRGAKAPAETHFFDWRGRNSLDIHFYGKLHAMGGIRCGVDRDNDIGHIGKKIYTMTEFFKSRAQYVEEANNG